MLNRVLVRKLEAAKSKAGIILSARQAGGAVARVVAVGPGAPGERGAALPVQARVGQTVLLPEYGGVKVELADGEYFVYRDNELLGALE